MQRQEPQSLVGCAGLRTAESDPCAGELGVELAPTYWGRYGYALEVTLTLLDFGFGKVDLRALYGSTVSVNERVARLASTIGAVAARRPGPRWMAARG